MAAIDVAGSATEQSVLGCKSDDRIAMKRR
jgi:hypothetical protein